MKLMLMTGKEIQIMMDIIKMILPLLISGR